MKISVMSDMAIVGSNPEWADLDNPHGAIYGEIRYVVAELPSGRRFRGPILPEECKSEKALGEVEAAFQQLVDAKVVKPEDEWQEMYPVYGSAAYTEQEPEIVFEEKQTTLDNEAFDVF